MEDLDSRIDALIGRLDRRIDDQLAAILAQPELARVRRAWSALAYALDVVGRASFVNVSPTALTGESAALTAAIERWDESPHLWLLVSMHGFHASDGPDTLRQLLPAAAARGVPLVVDLHDGRRLLRSGALGLAADRIGAYQRSPTAQLVCACFSSRPEGDISPAAMTAAAIVARLKDGGRLDEELGGDSAKAQEAGLTLVDAMTGSVDPVSLRVVPAMSGAMQRSAGGAVLRGSARFGLVVLGLLVAKRLRAELARGTFDRVDDATLGMTNYAAELLMAHEVSKALAMVLVRASGPASQALQLFIVPASPGTPSLACRVPVTLGD